MKRINYQHTSVVFVSAVLLFFLYNSFKIELTEPVKEVVTIYFCGTGITEDWWKGDSACAPDGLSGFWVPELVATLHHEERIDSISKYKHNNFIVNGIGTGLKIPALNILAQGFPSTPNNPRGWDECLNEAKSYLLSVLENSNGNVILNLIGHSRGGILCMWMAQEAYQFDKVKSINILCFDPVPGDADKEPMSIYLLNEKVKHYVGIYAEDERDGFFDPRIPGFNSSGTKYWMFTVPGSHETLVGNYQKDGHSTDFYNLNLFRPSEELIVELSNISWVTKVIAVELLGSEEWGEVKYNWNWSGNKETFISNYDSMYTYNEYEYMRTVSFVPISIAAYWAGPLRDTSCHWCNTVDMLAKKYNNDRCAKKTVNGESVVWVSLQNEIPRLSGTEAWNKLLELTDTRK